MKTFTIQELSATADEISDLIREVVTQTNPNAANSSQTWDRERIEKSLEQGHWIEARDETGTLVGVAAVKIKEGGIGYLSTNYVLVRRAGVGGAMLEARKKWAKEQGAIKVAATTHPWNKASIANLRKAGLDIVGEVPDTWAGEGTLLLFEGPISQKLQTEPAKNAERGSHRSI